MAGLRWSAGNRDQIRPNQLNAPCRGTPGSAASGKQRQQGARSILLFFPPHLLPFLQQRQKRNGAPHCIAPRSTGITQARGYVSLLAVSTSKPPRCHEHVLGWAYIRGSTVHTPSPRQAMLAQRTLPYRRIHCSLPRALFGVCQANGGRVSPFAWPDTRTCLSALPLVWAFFASPVGHGSFT